MDKSIREIQALANSIDVRINLFEGYFPKDTENRSGEILFWRHISNTYGLLADCDRVQIKSKSNLFEVMNRYNLISNDDFKEARLFWTDISAMRKWFCHNNDSALYYRQINERQVNKYIQKVYLLATNKPSHPDEIQKSDWNLLISDFERRYDSYLRILKKGLVNWKESDEKDDLIDEWIDIFSKALFEDKELISNVIADIADYHIKNEKLSVKTDVLGRNISRKLIECNFSVITIKNVLKQNNTKMSNREIIAESIKSLNLEY